MADLLRIENLRAGYGEAVVLPQMSLTLPEGQVLALLGRNGTGKTTLINSIVGITRRFGGALALALLGTRELWLSATGHRAQPNAPAAAPRTWSPRDSCAPAGR